MEAGLAHDVWTIEDVVELLENAWDHISFETKFTWEDEK
jgi:hypothetical protein